MPQGITRMSKYIESHTRKLCQQSNQERIRIARSLADYDIRILGHFNNPYSSEDQLVEFLSYSNYENIWWPIYQAEEARSF